MVSTGTIYTLEELSKDRNIRIGDSVRFVGRVKRIDATRDRIRVEDSLGNVLSVDSSLLNDMDMHLNKMYMFIGEIIRKFPPLSTCVQARVSHRVCGIDIKLYQEALSIRKAYLQKRV